MLEMPERPHIDNFRRQARALQRAARAGEPEAIARLDRHHPDPASADPKTLQLSAAQMVVAREYGFANWPQLVQYLKNGS
uniref:Uncharacterized protein n=1 Tax=uncultured bacterium esnapd14 TaxID=1366594 RepID=S5TUR0_9BACT|nr:hypothetical protein [uncultured bacterium esnapd14]